VGAGVGGYGTAETQVAGGGRQTSPDLTAAHWQGPGGGGYGDYSTGGTGGGGGGGRRPWWRSPVALIAVLVVLIGGGAAAYFVTSGNGGGTTGGSRARPPVISLPAPGCSNAAASSKQLPVKTGAAPVPSGNGNPFGVAASKDGKAVFVTSDTALHIYKVGPGGTLTADPWTYPIGGSPSGGVATNIILTNDGKYLLVAADNGIQVLDAIGAENGASSINKGVLAVPGLSKDRRAITVAVTPDDKFVFTSLQFADQVGVFNLAQYLSTGDSSSAYIGSLNVGTQPVGLTVSPDGKTLYATDFVDFKPVPGNLTVIDVAKATTKGEQTGAIIATAPAGCQPARVAVTSDGKTVWVTSRQSNYVLGYSASTLRTKPNKALIAKVKVGQWPIGIMLVNNESRLVISDNNGNDTSPTSTSKAHNLAVVDPGAALNGKPALIGYIPSGVTPRDMSVSPDGKYLYVVNRDSAQVQVVKLRTLP
jgi:DNA-binding beta-propeller fold protein YncE